MTMNTMNTVTISSKENDSFIKNNMYFFPKIVPFQRVKKVEKFRMKRCLEEGEGSYGSYSIISGLAF